VKGEKIMDRNFKFEVGETVKDIVTGYEGVVMAVSYYFTGCNHYGVCTRQTGEKEKVDDWKWFDEKRLERVPKKEKLIFGYGEPPSSGPMQNPPEI
jgi:hypothetical protein